MKPRRSLRSAPAQKHESTALATTRARVGPSSAGLPRIWVSSPLGPYWLWTSSISARRAPRSAREMAFRALGRLSSRTRMWPELGEGRLVTVMRGPADWAE